MARLDYCLVIGLLFWESSHPRALPYTSRWERDGQMDGVDAVVSTKWPKEVFVAALELQDLPSGSRGYELNNY